MAGDRRSQAAAARRNSCWAPVSSSGANPTSSKISTSLRSRVSIVRPMVFASQGSVEGLHQVGGAEVLDLVSGGPWPRPQPNQGMALADVGRADQGDVGVGVDPFQAGQLVECVLWDRREPC